MFRSKVTRINYTLNMAITELNMAHEEELLKALEKKIITGIEKQPDKNNNYLTNVQGKMTAFNFFNSDPDFKLFLESMFFRWSQDSLFYENMNKKTRMYKCNIVNSWGSILTKKDFVRRHDHLGTDFASVLYFGDSIINIDSTDKSANYKRQLSAQRGIVITFPSYVQHWVDPVNIPGKRVTLAWNWSFDKPWGESY